MKIVVADIETQEQLEVLKSLHCTFAQGWLLGHPMPASAIEERLTKECQQN